MPSTSKKQAKFMAAAAHNPEFAKKVGISMDVAKEFNKADAGRVDLQKVAKPKTDHGKSKLFKEGGMAASKLKKLFKGKESMKEELAEAKAIKSGKITPMEYAKGEKMEGHKKGGVAKTVTKEMEYDYKTGKKSFAGTTAQRDAHAEKEGKIVAKHAAYDKAKGMCTGGKAMKKMAGGGYVRAADGIAQKGKTKGKIV